MGLMMKTSSSNLSYLDWVLTFDALCGYNDGKIIDVASLREIDSLVRMRRDKAEKRAAEEVSMVLLF